MALITSLTARAELPRLVPLFTFPADDDRPDYAELAAAAQRLALVESGQDGGSAIDADAQLIAAMKDGTIENGDGIKKVAKLRCARSPLLDRKEYRYLPGPDGRLAVLVLEEDDLEMTCARLDAVCGPASFERFWRVLVNIAACPTP